MSSVFVRRFPAEASPVTLSNIIKAIASFERVLVSADSAFDRYLYKTIAAACPRRPVVASRFSFPIAFAAASATAASTCRAHDLCRRDAFRSRGVLSRYRRGDEACQISSAHSSQHRRHRAVHAQRKHCHAEGCRCSTTRGWPATPGRRATVSEASRSHRRKPTISSRSFGSMTDQKFLTNPAFSNPLSNPDMREELKRGERTKSDPPEWLKGH